MNLVHKIDTLTRTRRRWWPAIDDYLSSSASPIDGYAVYSIYPKERVGLVREPVQDVADRFRRLGFSPEPIAALKIRASEPHEPSAGSWVIKGPELADLFHEDMFNPDHSVLEMQLHITLFALPEGTEVNAHYEYRWEPWTPHWDSERPLKHKRPTKYGGHYSPAEGVEMVTALFDAEGIPYDIKYKHD